MKAEKRRKSVLESKVNSFLSGSNSNRVLKKLDLDDKMALLRSRCLRRLTEAGVTAVAAVAVDEEVETDVFVLSLDCLPSTEPPAALASVVGVEAYIDLETEGEDEMGEKRGLEDERSGNGAAIGSAVLDAYVAVKVAAANFCGSESAETWGAGLVREAGMGFGSWYAQMMKS